MAREVTQAEIVSGLSVGYSAFDASTYLLSDKKQMPIR
jgi:hypothetical protein